MASSCLPRKQLFVVLMFLLGLTQLASAYNATMAKDMAEMSLRAYGVLGPLASFLGISNFRVDLTGTPYTLLKTFVVANDFGFVAKYDKICLASFRGTDSILLPDWVGRVGNLDVTWGPFRKNRGDGDTIVYMHNGFRSLYDAFRYETTCTGIWPFQNCKKGRTPFYDSIRACLTNDPESILVITGHSRGAALASTMAAHYATDETLDLDDDGNKAFNLARLRTKSSPYLRLYTYGEPRSLIDKDAPQLEQVLAINKYRFVHGNDIVPGIPFRLPLLPYTHWGSAFRILDSTKKVQAVSTDFPTKASETLNIFDHLPNLYCVSFY